MLNTRTIAIQTARRVLWVNLILTFLVSVFSLVFVPFFHENTMGWFVVIPVVGYILVYYSMSFRSKITVDKAFNYTICIPDHSSNTSHKIPLEYITHIETCEYRLFNNSNYYPCGVDQSYFYTKTMFGYIGLGLIVCYKIPKSLSGDSITRGICFPAPKANEFLKFVKENTLG